MTELVDNIGVLIDESVDIVDINAEDEFIMNVHDEFLNEGLEEQLEEVGIVLEFTSGNYAERAKARRRIADNRQGQIMANTDAGQLDGPEDRWMANLEKQLAAKDPTNSKIINQEITKNNADSWDPNTKDWSTPATVTPEIAKKIQNTPTVKVPFDPNTPGQGHDMPPSFFDSIKRGLEQNPLLALGGAVIAAAGAYLIYRYVNSIYRLNKATNYYKQLASSTKDPAKKAEYTRKASMYAQRLEQAKAKARENKKGYIAKTREMQSSLVQMKKSNSDPRAVAKLEKKLAARNKVLAKIGAI